MSVFSESPRHRPDRLEIQARLLTIEELLVSGVSAPRVERELAKKFSIGRRQMRRYIQQVLANWQDDSREDVAIRREKLYRMAERLYGKAYAKESLTAGTYPPERTLTGS